MSKKFPTYEALSTTAQPEKLTVIEKVAIWFRDFLENAE